MPHRTLPVFLALALCLALLPIGTAAGADPAAPALAFLELAFAGETGAAEAMMTDAMREALAAQGGLHAAIASLNPSGDAPALGEAAVSTESGMTVVTVPVALETPLRAQVALDAEGRVAGLYFLPAENDPLVALARDTLTAAFTGEYAAAEAAFSPEMAQGVAQNGGLAAMMGQVLDTYGEMTAVGPAARSESQGMTLITFPVAFERVELNVTVSLNAAGRVSGLVMQPQVDVVWPDLPYGASEEEVTVDAGTGYPLGGTLCLPAADSQEPVPVVLLIQGSGANGRDETVGANPVFAQLAYGLAERGIASLRYDKRTFRYPEIQLNPEYTVDMEYVEDVLAATLLLQADPRIDGDRVFLAGHSQGGMLAPRFANEGADVAGLVLMAGTARTLADILYDQQMNVLNLTPDAAQTEGLGAMYDAWREEAEAVFALDRDDAKAHAGLYGGAFPALYMWDMVNYENAIDLLLASDLPVLIQQGENDWQVYADIDYALYTDRLADRPDTTFRLYETLNHLFMPSRAETITDAIVEYNTPAEIPAEVIDDIAAFVKEN